MAWALKDPDGFGKYWPLGDFVGWFEQLRTYATATRDEMSDELQSLIFDDENNNIFISPLVDKFRTNAPPVVEAESPQEFRTEKSHKELHSMIETECQVLAVDGAMKHLIEQFEPGVHQFFPFTIMMPRDKIFPKQYYILVIRQFIEGFVLKDGTYRENGYKPNYYPIDGNKKGYNKLEVSKAAINGAHLWRDTRMTDPNVFISDALQAAIKEAGLTIFRHHKVKEV